MDEIKSMMGSDKYKIYSLYVEDKFGDLGLTGVAIIKIEKEAYFIDNFLLSCRILSRKIENQFFYEIIKLLNKIVLRLKLNILKQLKIK